MEILFTCTESLFRNPGPDLLRNNLGEVRDHVLDYGQPNIRRKYFGVSENVVFIYPATTVHVLGSFRERAKNSGAREHMMKGVWAARRV